MTDRWPDLSRLFDEAMLLPREERAAFAERSCKDDVELLADLSRMLQAVEIEDDFLVPPHAFLEESPPAEVPFGNYTLLEQIGRGGMGVVFRGRQVGLGREVAVKILSPALGLDVDQRQRFMDEAQKIARLDHPGIVRVHDVGEERGLPFYSMELIAGQDLARIIDASEAGEGLLASQSNDEIERIVAELVSDIADALSHAHQRDIVHRDVKPRNIIIDAAGKPRLVDFGIARDLSYGTVTRTADVLGSPHYMSPEQARVADRAGIDQRTDVYSLGIVLYELLTRVRPFDGDTVDQILDNIRYRRYTKISILAPQVAPDLIRICEAAMAERPDDRYPSAAAFAQDLQRFLSGIPAVPPSVPRVEKARRHLSRRRFVYLSALASTSLGATGYLAIRAMRRAGQVEVRLSAADAQSGSEIRGTVFVASDHRPCRLFRPLGCPRRASERSRMARAWLLSLHLQAE